MMVPDFHVPARVVQSTALSSDLRTPSRRHGALCRGEPLACVPSGRQAPLPRSRAGKGVGVAVVPSRGSRARCDGAWSHARAREAGVAQRLDVRCAARAQARRDERCRTPRKRLSRPLPSAHIRTHPRRHLSLLLRMSLRARPRQAAMCPTCMPFAIVYMSSLDICFPGADVPDRVEFESGLTNKTRGKLPVASMAKKQKLNLVRLPCPPFTPSLECLPPVNMATDFHVCK